MILNKCSFWIWIVRSLWAFTTMFYSVHKHACVSVWHSLYDIRVSHFFYTKLFDNIFHFYSKPFYVILCTIHGLPAPLRYICNILLYSFYLTHWILQIITSHCWSLTEKANDPLFQRLYFLASTLQFIHFKWLLYVFHSSHWDQISKAFIAVSL